MLIQHLIMLRTEATRKQGRRTRMKKLVIPIAIILLLASFIILISAMIYDYIRYPSDREKYSELKKMWANRGNWLELEASRFFRKIGVHELEFEILKPLAEKGFDSAQNNLGRVYYCGRGAPQNYEKAAEWYQKAAEQGNKNAQNNLGLMYADGIGVPQSSDKAIKWFKKAAKRGVVNAQYNLGVAYALRDDGSDSDILGYMWFSIAKANGDKGNVEKSLKTLKERMPPEDIKKAVAMATRCWESKYQDCGNE